MVIGTVIVMGISTAIATAIATAIVTALLIKEDIMIIAGRLIQHIQIYMQKVYYMRNK